MTLLSSSTESNRRTKWDFSLSFSLSLFLSLINTHLRLSFPALSRFNLAFTKGANDYDGCTQIEITPQMSMLTVRLWTRARVSNHKFNPSCSVKMVFTLLCTLYNLRCNLSCKNQKPASAYRYTNFYL